MILEILDVLRGKAVIIPKKPTSIMLFNMAMKEDHSFGLVFPDEEVKQILAESPIMKGSIHSETEHRYTLARMADLYREIVERHELI